ncbi:MAG: hypothetical protein MUF04_10645 [Akkermansiaceae bacterium]|jgi:hypothetical protein|nr:hypothetical protein [Akkermansiaceae bacterium]
MPARNTPAKKAARRATRAPELVLPESAAAKVIETTNPFKKAWDKLKDISVDLATVDVTTFRGDITAEASASGKFDPAEFFNKLRGEISGSSTLTLVAHTHVEFDLDCVMIVKPDADLKLLEAHSKAVQAAVDARLGVVRIVGDFLKDLAF